MEKQFLNLLAATTTRAQDLNATWKKVIGYAVKKAHSDKEHGLEYVQMSLDTAVGGVRKGVASAFRQLNINITALEHGQYRAEGVRQPKKQEEVFARIKANDLPDVVAMTDRIPKAKKDKAAEPADVVAQDAIDRLIARLKKDNPAAAAIVNDRLAGKEVEKIVERPVEQYTPNSICVGDAEDIFCVTPEEMDVVLKALNTHRIGKLKAA